MSKGKILVIDDNPAVTKLLSKVLTQEGYAAVTSNEPTTGEALVDKENPDLIVLDICMPEIDGWELCRRIREKHHMPILALTILTKPQDIKRCFEAGADAYMPKPFPVKGLLKRVNSLLQQGPRRQDNHE